MSMVKPEVKQHEADVCVVGGGIAGCAAAWEAANAGARVVMLHDRPMLGGNASSECRIHICGADRHGKLPNMRDTGFIEELRLHNARYNPRGSWGKWDAILYEKIYQHPGIKVLLNCSCLDATVEAGAIKSARGWQLQSELYHEVAAKFFIDASGDGVLAPLVGAPFRIGREAKAEYDEALAPEKAEDKTMGHTLLFSLRDCGEPVEFIRPEWAYHYPECTDMPYGLGGHRRACFTGQLSHWWIEYGGEVDTIKDNEAIRDELLKILFGFFDHIKNICPERALAQNFEIDFLQFLPAKRESRRYEGEYVLRAGDLETKREFADAIGHGGWTMDDHDSAGFYAARDGRAATAFNPCVPGYSIPLRSTIARGVKNLFCAGRNASCTHLAMSSTRVMATGSLMGCAAGVAAAMLAKRQLSAATDILADDLLPVLQQHLLKGDQYIPGQRLAADPVAKSASFSGGQGDAAVLTNGISRDVDEEINHLTLTVGQPLECSFAEAQMISEVGMMLDTELDAKNLEMSWFYKPGTSRLPPALPRQLTVEGKVAGAWETIYQTDDNYHRTLWLPVGKKVEALRLTINQLCGGGETTRLYGFYPCAGSAD